MTELTPSFNDQSPLYDQLYRYIVSLIRSGELPAGEKLPSKRRLCEHLGVSLTTVERSYGLLTAEGYLDARPRSGYRVAQLLTLPLASAEPAAPPPLVKESGRHDREEEPSPLDERFSTAAVDTSVFPYATWARLSKEAVYENPDLLQRGEGQGDLALRAELSRFLHQYRGVRCTPDQIIVGAGMEALLWVLLQLLPGATFALEDPGYAALRGLLDNLNWPYVGVAVDEKGMSAQALAESGADVAYVTPSHQFPLGVTTPATRRSELLHWAYARPGRYLIEDDYDSEFRYASRPIPAMQGGDDHGRVIYLGTFSRTLAPSIRVAYLILPPALLEVYRAKFGHGAATVSRFEQEALRRFVASGSYSRHLRRVGHLYRQRRDALVTALSVWGQVSGADAGLHLLFTLPGREEDDLVARAAAAGIQVRGLSQFSLSAPPREGTLVLGFAGLPAAEAPQLAQRLRQALCDGVAL